MKLVNGKLEKIDNDEIISSIEAIIAKEEEFLLNKGYSNEISKRKDNLLILYCDSNYNISINDRLKSQNIPENAAAICRTLVYDMGKDNWKFTNGVILRKSNSSHNISHELFHALSKNNILESENGVFYDKTGVKIIGYNENGDEVDESLNADFLNEGITEMLTNEFCNEKEVGAYPFATYVAKLLTIHDDELLQAYFSKEKSDFKKFLNDFDSKQSIISSNELVEINSKTMLSDDEMFNLVNACVTYGINSIDNIEKRQELIIKYNNILEEMDNNYLVSLNNNEKYCNTINNNIDRNK